MLCMQEGPTQGVWDFGTLGVWSGKRQAPRGPKAGATWKDFRVWDSGGFENRGNWLKCQSAKTQKCPLL
jgi:hypothetical protein